MPETTADRLYIRVKGSRRALSPTPPPKPRNETPYSAHSSQAPPSGACFFVHASRASTAPRWGLRSVSQCGYFPAHPAGFIVLPRRPTMAIVRYQGAACLALLALAACAREGEDKMGWARAALERNDRLEGVAAGPHSRTFTVRVADTGGVGRVRRAQRARSVPTAARLPAQAKQQARKTPTRSPHRPRRPRRRRRRGADECWREGRGPPSKLAP